MKSPSQPPEDLQVHHKAGAQTEARAPVHHRAQGDLHPEVHPAPAGGQTPADQVVPGPHPGRPRRLLRRGERCCSGYFPGIRERRRAVLRGAASTVRARPRPPRHRLPQSGGSQAGQETTVLTEGSSFLRPGRQQQDRTAVRDSLLSYLMDFSLLRPGDSRLHRAHYVATTLSNLINYLSIYLPIYLSLLIILFTTPVPSCKIYPKSHSQVILLFKNTSCLT